MNLVSALLSGIAGAANGWAEVCIRGSSTRATIYEDFEASTSDSSGDDIDLDAYGAVEIYVNQLVDIVAKAPDGTVIRSWTDGYASGNVEVISPAFTGHDYVSGAAAVSEPTTLQAVLDLWVTNAGGPDWKVNVGGTNVTLLNAFGSLAGLVYNVKSPVYGATGDGITNDQSAIQAALAAAVAAGGGTVFFPKGTYLISSAMEWDHRVAMMGVGQDVSIITTNSASNARMVTFTTGTIRSLPVKISGMTFQSTQTNSGEIIYSTVPVNLLVENCNLGATATSTGTLISVAGASILAVSGGRLTINSTAGTAITTALAGRTMITNTVVAPTNTSYTGSALKLTGYITMTGVELDFSSVTLTSPNYAIELQNADDSLRITGTTVYSTSQYPNYGLRLFAGAQVWAAGNGLSGFTGVYSIASGVLQSGSYLEMGAADNVTSALTTHTIPSSVSGAGYRLTGTVPTLTLPTAFFPGQRLTVGVENKSGSAWSVNTSNFFSGDLNYGPTTSPSCADAVAVIAEFVVLAVNSSTFQWLCSNVHVGSEVT